MLRFILSIFVLALTVNAIAQPETVKTKSGKTVILNPDGTWKYVEEVATADRPKKGSDCSDYVETTEDKMTGKKSSNSRGSIIVSDDDGKTGLSIVMLKFGDNSIILAIKAVGAGNCVDENSKINILFKDGSRMEILSDGKFNCKGDATVYFGGIFGKKKQLEELTTKEIQAMRVWTTNGYVEKDFSATNASEFLQTINCLLKM